MTVSAHKSVSDAMSLSNVMTSFDSRGLLGEGFGFRFSSQFHRTHLFSLKQYLNKPRLLPARNQNNKQKIIRSIHVIISH